MIAVRRQTADLTTYPDLIVIYLGMKAHSFRGFLALLKRGPAIQKAMSSNPDGLLYHEENIVYSLFPPHFGMRQYWRDFESLEKWTRELPHMEWWKDFLGREQGVSFWHETYSVRGGIESVYLSPKDRLPKFGVLGFAPNVEAKGSMFSARRRLQREGDGRPPVVAEE